MSSPETPNAVDLEAQGIPLDQQLPSSAHTGHIEIDGYTLAYTDMPALGEHKGTGLLIPGYTSSMATFNMLLEPLARRGYRVVSFSQRGQSLSEGPDDVSGYALERLGRDVHDIAETLELGANIHLLGHSFGGVVGTEAVIADPTRFASFTSWNSGPKSMGEVLLPQRDALIAHGPRAFWIADRISQGLDPEMDRTGELNPIEQYYLNRLMTTNPAQLLAGITILLDQQDRVEQLKDTGVPVLVSHGANDDAWPIPWQRDMAERLGANYWVIAGAGHSAQADKSLTSANLLAAFWDEHNN